jgi:hypothetical protein
MFRSVTAEEFNAALADSPPSPAFREHLARFVSFDEWLALDAKVHDGNLRVSGSFGAPGLCTLIAGHLDVDGTIDLRNDYDEGGLFIVIGNVTCRHFVSNYAACSFVDGDLEARESIINGFSDSALSVVGTLRTRLFIGRDIWAEVGAGAEIEYGEGYCLPFGYTDPERQAIMPRHDEAATARVVVPPTNDEGYVFDVEPFVDRISAGQPIFR